MPLCGGWKRNSSTGNLRDAEEVTFSAEPIEIKTMSKKEVSKIFKSLNILNITFSPSAEPMGQGDSLICGRC